MRATGDDTGLPRADGGEHEQNFIKHRTAPFESGEDPFVPYGTWQPGDDVPYDPYIKNSGGGVDLPS